MRLIKYLTERMNEARAERDQARAERDQARAERDQARAERDQAQVELEDWKRRYKSILFRLSEEVDAYQHERARADE